MSNTLLKRTLFHLEKLVSFDTSNPPRAYKASGIIEYLSGVLADAQVTIQDHGSDSINILAVKGNPKYLFNFHMDTVPIANGWDSDPHTLTLKADKAYALGACDIKGAAAAMLACIEQGVEHYALLFSSDEEHGSSTCIKEFVKQEHSYQGVIVAEPTQAQAVIAHRGIHTASLEMSSVSGHSSEKRALFDNAIHQFSQWAVSAVALAKGFEKASYFNLSGICLNIGKVVGGIKPNIIADHLSAEFGVRPLPGQSGEQILGQLSKLLPNAATSKLTAKFVAPALPCSEDAISGKSLAKSLSLTIGPAVNFWTEAALFSQVGFPSIVYGPGNIAQAHTANEWVELSQLEEVANNYLRILKNVE